MTPRLAALEILCTPDPATKAMRARALFTALDGGPIDNGSIDNGSIDIGSIDNGAIHIGSIHNNPPIDVGSSEPGSADDSSADRRVIATGPAAPATHPRSPSTSGATRLPGRPPLPRLVPPKAVPSRSPFTLEGRAALLHAVTHIEFNAINLALDAVWRFPGLPDAYYRDWLQVASEEALHFSLLREHLQGLGYDYGSFDAHDGLWLMTERTADDVTARMALVPRTLEARGLDAAPPMQAKLRQAGDTRAADILGVILRDEVGHVAIGNRWYRWLCARDGHDPVALYPLLAARYQAPRLRPPFNLGARRAAGFSEEELARLGA